MFLACVRASLWCLEFWALPCARRRGLLAVAHRAVRAGPFNLKTNLRLILWAGRDQQVAAAPASIPIEYPAVRGQPRVQPWHHGFGSVRDFHLGENKRNELFAL